MSEARIIELLVEIRDLLVEIKDPPLIPLPHHAVATKMRRQWREEIGTDHG